MAKKARKKKGVKLGSLVLASAAIREAQREVRGLKKGKTAPVRARLDLKVEKLKKAYRMLADSCDGLYV